MSARRILPARVRPGVMVPGASAPTALPDAAPFADPKAIKRQFWDAVTRNRGNPQ